MMRKLDWHFNDYPPVDEETKLSSSVLVKLTDGSLVVTEYDDALKAWRDIVAGLKVCCWAYIGLVPETLTPMPEDR